MKSYVISGIFLVSMVVQQVFALPLYKETPHLVVYCLQVDQAAADDMAAQGDAFCEQLTHDFNHNRSKKIEFKIYSDISLLHEALNWLTAPDWIIGRFEGNVIYTVSTMNPGPAHSSSSVFCSIKASMTEAFVCDKYSNYQLIPCWLFQGVGLYKAHFYPGVNNKLAQIIDELPLFEDLEKVNNNALAFAKLHGYWVAYSMIEFIDHKWGWETILHLLEDYSKFEEILGMSKSEFRAQWIEYIRAQLEVAEVNA